jgi:hypothetical protein
MSNRIIPTAVVVASLGWAAPFAQPKTGDRDLKPNGDVKPAAKTEAVGEGATFELRMTDDTVLKVELLDKSVSLLTKYGKLVIPAAEIRRLEFGFRYPDGAEAKIENAIAELGSPDFKTREKGEKQLIKIGLHAIPNLRKAEKSDNPEVVHRAQEILKSLEGKLEEGKPELRNYDVVETPEFTAKGQLLINVLSVRTKHFGETIVKLTDIRSFHAVGHSSKVEISLDAAKYGKMNQSEWMETAIDLSAGQQLEVAASGQVDQWPQGPGQYMVGPEGLANGFRQGMGATGLPGQVIGRIGASGTPFSIGASYKGKATESGKLYLRIGASPWNCPSTGSYKVVVKVASP